MSDNATTAMTFEDAPKMRGSGGHIDYVILAVRNGVALGFKFYGATPVDLPDTGRHARFHWHMRSCRPYDHELEQLKLGNVTQFGTYDTLAEYWPGFEFKDNGSADPDAMPHTYRASGPLYYFAKGAVTYDDDTNTVTVPEGLEDGTAADKIADQMVEIADPGTAVLTKEQIRSIVQQFIDTVVAQMRASTTSSLGLSGGVASAGSLSKQMMNQLGIGTGKAAKADDDDDEDGDDFDNEEEDYNPETEELIVEEDDEPLTLGEMQDIEDEAKKQADTQDPEDAGHSETDGLPTDEDKSNG